MNDINDAILELWCNMEKKLRRDEVGRELFKELLKRVYIKIKNE